MDGCAFSGLDGPVRAFNYWETLVIERLRQDRRTHLCSALHVWCGVSSRLGGKVRVVVRRTATAELSDLVKLSKSLSLLARLFEAPLTALPSVLLPSRSSDRLRFHPADIPAERLAQHQRLACSPVFTPEINNGESAVSCNEVSLHPGLPNLVTGNGGSVI